MQQTAMSTMTMNAEQQGLVTLEMMQAAAKLLEKHTGTGRASTKIHLSSFSQWAAEDDTQLTNSR
jgi:hypothetical protein